MVFIKWQNRDPCGDGQLDILGVVVKTSTHNEIVSSPESCS